ncbi:MAG: MipA/OmpV family protein [Burkholderiaceae bacterium]
MDLSHRLPDQELTIVLNRTRWRCGALILLALAFGPPALAASGDSPAAGWIPPKLGTETPTDSPFSIAGRPVRQYVIGATTSIGPGFRDSGGPGITVRPLVALEVGRLTVSTGGGGSLLSFGNVDDPKERRGASLSLVQETDLRVSLGLRVSSGRDPDEINGVEQLPGVKRTVLGRISLSFSLPGEWSGVIGFNQDILGNGQGLTVSFGLGRVWWLNETTQMQLGAGLVWADKEHMDTMYGVNSVVAATVGLPAYAPKGSAREISAGVGITHALTRRWIGFASLTATALMASAANSPITQRTVLPSIRFGFAYRCCN